MRCTDGAVILADVLFVSESERDVIYELVSSNRPERYVKFAGGEAWSTPIDEIDFIRLIE